MKFQEIIESGVIELYVMNALPAAEAAQVEAWSHEFPRVKAEIEDIQAALQMYSQAHAVEPPVDLKEKIISAIESEQANNLQPAETVAETPLSNSSNSPRFGRIFPWLLAAASLAAAGFGFYQNTQAKRQLTECSAENQELFKNKKAVVDLQQKLDILRSPDTKTIELKGLPLSPDSKAIVYWNAKERATYLSILNLPAPPSGKQYQLWAIVDKKPVDAGIFNYDLAAVQTMKIFDKAEAFAVTLEPEGGSVAPTLTNMYVLGTP